MKRTEEEIAREFDHEPAQIRRLAAIRDALSEEKPKLYRVTLRNDLGDIYGWYGYCDSSRTARKNALAAVVERRPYWRGVRVLSCRIHTFTPRKVV